MGLTWWEAVLWTLAIIAFWAALWLVGDVASNRWQDYWAARISRESEAVRQLGTKAQRDARMVEMRDAILASPEAQAAEEEAYKA